MKNYLHYFMINFSVHFYVLRVKIRVSISIIDVPSTSQERENSNFIITGCSLSRGNLDYLNEICFILPNLIIEFIGYFTKVFF